MVQTCSSCMISMSVLRRRRCLAANRDRLLRPLTFDAVSAILSDEAVYDTLRRDMLARAVVQMLDDFADGSDRTLSAFRNAFLGISGSG